MTNETKVLASSIAFKKLVDELEETIRPVTYSGFKPFAAAGMSYELFCAEQGAKQEMVAYLRSLHELAKKP